AGQLHALSLSVASDTCILATAGLLRDYRKEDPVNVSARSTSL
ncbi:MAG: hypothetical protein QOK09_823, partial [Mycobacterium sp.]|nr:hypothetical protein [Mycobacterium sp.]